MLASLVLERDPLGTSDAWPLVVSWLQDAGGFAAILFVVWLIVQLFRWKKFRAETGRALFTVIMICLVGSLLGYAVYGVAKVVEYDLMKRAEAAATHGPPPLTPGGRVAIYVENISLAAAGALALLAISLPLVVDVFSARIKPRRIWALARLSMKEAVRRRVLWVFTALLAVYLFAKWFIEHNKPEHQVHAYVSILYDAMTPVLLLTAALLAAFAIPTDIKQQTIHTVLTKPVERFEIVLGRFLGYTLIFTLVLFTLSILSLGYLLRGVNPDAKNESLKARIPLYGDLEFEGTKEKKKGVNVGREWEYRSYISGHTPPLPQQFAIWTFNEIPAQLAARDQVRCEYTFIIYRTTKGVDNKGVPCTFYVETWRFDPQMEKEYQNDMTDAEKEPTFDRKTTENELAEKYGKFELPGRSVVDYHTLAFEIPGGLFKNALAPDEDRRRLMEAQYGKDFPLLRVRVSCDDRNQYIGMAKSDLFLRVDDPKTGAETHWYSLWQLNDDTLWFCWNFLKGACGLWFRLCLVIGLAITFSTYLSGVISSILTAVVYVGGFFREWIGSLADPLRTSAGAPVDSVGPMESFVRLVRRDNNSIIPLEETTQKIVTVYDEFFRWLLRRVMNVLPDVNRFNLSDFVSEGFNISPTSLLMDTLLLVGFLVPLAILAYHLLRGREVASAT